MTQIITHRMMLLEQTYMLKSY